MFFVIIESVTTLTIAEKYDIIPQTYIYKFRLDIICIYESAYGPNTSDTLFKDIIR